MEKSYKMSKYPNKIHILLKQLNKKRDSNKISVGVVGFAVGGWFVIKLKGVCMFVAEKK